MVRQDDILDQLLMEAMADWSESGDEPDLQTLADIVDAKVQGRAAGAQTDALGFEERFLVDVAAEAEIQWLSMQETDQIPLAQSVGTRFKAVLLWAKDGLDFVWGTLSPVPLAPAAAVRSSNASAQRSYCAFEAQAGSEPLLVEIERRPSHGFDLQLSASRPRASAGWRATLVRGGKLVESAPLDEGRVCFTGLLPAIYRVTLSVGGRTLIEFDLKFVTD